MSKPSRRIGTGKGKGRELSPPIATTMASEGQTSSVFDVHMHDDTPRVLRCIVEGDPAVFKVKVPVDNDVDDLKKLVHREKDKGILRDVNASDLALWKVRYFQKPVATQLTPSKVDINLNNVDDDFLKNLMVNDVKDVEKLTAWKPISTYWPSQPFNDRLHIFVQGPAGESRGSSLVHMNALRLPHFAFLWSFERC